MSAGCNSPQSVNLPGADWPFYGGNSNGNRYSELKQIHAGNVKELAVAWTYDARESPAPGSPPPKRGKSIQCQPIVVRGVMYGTTAELELFALDAATGKEIWKFTPLKDEQTFNTNRGVVYWKEGDDERILYSAGASLYAVNAKDGKPVNRFGLNGRVDLHGGLSENFDFDVNKLSVTATSPGALYKNTIIMGSSVSEGGDAAPGHVRGFDVVTGKLKWIFHTIPHPGEFGYDTWPADAHKKIGGANAWSGLVVDQKRGAVYFGTGSPSSDFYGGDRTGINLYANCIISLQAETGKMNWYFQTIHHDLWDRDLPCPPNLATVKHQGKAVDVVVQATKDGLVYILDRDSGMSLFPVEERAVPVKALPGENPWPTQKYPLKPAPFAHQVLSDSDITNISPEAHAYVKKRLSELPRTDNKFSPPSEAGTVLFGYSGGAEWGGNAVDPQGVLYQNSNNDPWELSMVNAAERDQKMSALSKGNSLYIRHCAVCHGEDRKGSGNTFPSLINIGSRRSASEISKVISSGLGRMPSFRNLTADEHKSIAGFLTNSESFRPAAHPGTEAAKEKKAVPYSPKYVSRKWKILTDQEGYPAVKPPWGYLNAIDLNTGEYRWRVPLGEYPELTKRGIPVTGTDSYGGPLVTAGGLVFIAGTRDERFRAFDSKTGKIVWEYQLPAGGFATPVTYEVDGKQYIAIAAAGARGQKLGKGYMAFSLKPIEVPNGH
ncbi:MAG: PQQ-binding-like beta-propeller repeat protein [Chitinophagaceae bacterium]